MSNFSKQQDAQLEGKERKRTRKENLAKYFFDLSKLTFAALVLGGLSPLINNDMERISLSPIIMGTIAAYFFAFFANRILK